MKKNEIMRIIGIFFFLAILAGLSYFIIDFIGLV